MHPAGTRYAPIEGEGLAVANAELSFDFGFKWEYPLFTNFLLQTNFINADFLFQAAWNKLKQLTTNLMNDGSLADIPNRRLLNLKENTLSFNFKIVYVPGRKHVGRDAALRLPVDPAERPCLP